MSLLEFEKSVDKSILATNNVSNMLHVQDILVKLEADVMLSNDTNMLKANDIAISFFSSYVIY